MAASQSCFAFMVALIFAVFDNVHGFVEMPKFSQLTLLYPGYHLHGGHTRNRDVTALIGGNHSNVIRNLHNTSPLRMSIALNKYAGRHAIGTEPISLDGEGVVSVQGSDSQQYIFHNTAFGPFLASKYGNPLLGKPNKHEAGSTMDPFHGKQGIVRFVSYHTDHAGGHIGLWDCDHLFQSPDWTTEHHMISVEFWETPDSYCAPKDDSMDLHQLLQNYRLVPRTEPGAETEPETEPHNQETHSSPRQHRGHMTEHDVDIPENTLQPRRTHLKTHRLRHSKRVRNHHHRLKEILLRH